MSPEVYVKAGNDGKIALFLAPFNTVILIIINYECKVNADIHKSMFKLYMS